MQPLDVLLGQDKIISTILQWLESDSKVLLIRGRSGTGKSHLANQAGNEWRQSHHDRNVIYAEGDFSSIERILLPLSIGLEQARKVLWKQATLEKGYSQLARGVPGIGGFLSYVFDVLSNRSADIKKDKLSYLTAAEQDILLSLNSYYRGSKLLLIADNFHWWDKVSINLINLILSGKLDDIFSFIAHFKVLVVVTDDQMDEAMQKNIEEFISKNSCTQIYTKPLEKEKFNDVFQSLGAVKHVNAKSQDLIFSLTGGHLELIKKLALLNEQGLQDVFFSETNTLNNGKIAQYDLLGRILIERFEFLGADYEQISKVLEYAAIIGFSFTFDEIACLTKDREDKIKSILMKAREASLLQDDSAENKFSHEIVRDFFIQRIGNKKYEYYENFATCLKVLRPAEYFERARLLFEAGQVEKALPLYIIGYLKNLRTGLIVPQVVTSRIQALADQYNLRTYFETMLHAYDLFGKGNYIEARLKLEAIEDVYPEILMAEKYYLLSLCTSKNLDLGDLLRSKNYLEGWENLKVEEGEIWVRIMLTLMSRHAHLNEYDKAELIERKLMAYFSQRSSFDLEARHGLNVLRRKASILHSSEVACKRTEDSLAYFGHEILPKLYRSPIQFYMALANHSGNLIIAGEFNTAYEYSQEAIALQKIYPEVIFPRIEVPINNYTLSSLLSKTLTAHQCIEVYDSLFKRLNNSEERILLKSNYIVLKALSGKLEEALIHSEALKKLLSNASRKDNYYNYFVGINHAVIIYLTSGHNSALPLLDILVQDAPSIPDKVFLLKRHELIRTLMQETEISDPLIWNDELYKRNPQELGPSWRFWSKGFLFTDMQFWSDS
jgi:hypothetical protein